MMMRIAALLFLMSSAATAAEPLKSGTPVGKRPGPYSFLVATGPQRGQPTCYICEQEKKPTVVVFARTLNEPLGKLLSKLDAEMAAKKDAGFKAWMTLLTTTADLDALAKWSQKQGLKSVPVGAFEDPDGPPAYTLATGADVTVLLFVKEKVVANFALKPGNLTDETIAAIVKTLPQLYEGK